MTKRLADKCSAKGEMWLTTVTHASNNAASCSVRYALQSSVFEVNFFFALLGLANQILLHRFVFFLIKICLRVLSSFWFVS